MSNIVYLFLPRIKLTITMSRIDKKIIIFLFFNCYQKPVLGYKVCLWMLLFLLSCVCFPMAIDSKTNESVSLYEKEKMVEDFENFDLQKYHLKNKYNISPHFKISKYLTSPTKISRNSFMIRLTKGSSSFHIQFNTPYEIQGYIESFHFEVFSNNTGGTIFLFLVDSHYLQHKIIIGKLDFKGWKSISVPIQNKIVQNDLTLYQNAKMKFVGLLYEAPKVINEENERLIVLDDISVKTRDKYKIDQVKIQGLIR